MHNGVGTGEKRNFAQKRLFDLENICHQFLRSGYFRGKADQFVQGVWGVYLVHLVQVGSMVHLVIQIDQMIQVVGAVMVQQV